MNSSFHIRCLSRSVNMSCRSMLIINPCGDERSAAHGTHSGKACRERYPAWSMNRYVRVRHRRHRSIRLEISTKNFGQVFFLLLLLLSRYWIALKCRKMKKRQRLHRVCLEEGEESIRSKEEKRMWYCSTRWRRDICWLDHCFLPDRFLLRTSLFDWCGSDRSDRVRSIGRGTCSTSNTTTTTTYRRRSSRTTTPERRRTSERERQCLAWQISTTNKAIVSLSRHLFRLSHRRYCLCRRTLT